MSSLVNSSVLYLHNALCISPKVGDIVRFDDTGVECWRCDGHLEAAYCENRLYAVRCACGCAGVFLVSGSNPVNAAEIVAGQEQAGGVSGG